MGPIPGITVFFIIYFGNCYWSLQPLLLTTTNFTNLWKTLFYPIIQTPPSLPFPPPPSPLVFSDTTKSLFFVLGTHRIVIPLHFFKQKNIQWNHDSMYKILNEIIQYVCMHFVYNNENEFRTRSTMETCFCYSIGDAYKINNENRCRLCSHSLYYNGNMFPLWILYTLIQRKCVFVGMTFLEKK